MQLKETPTQQKKKQEPGRNFDNSTWFLTEYTL